MNVLKGYIVVWRRQKSVEILLELMSVILSVRRDSFIVLVLEIVLVSVVM